MILHLKIVTLPVCNMTALQKCKVLFCLTSSKMIEGKKVKALKNMHYIATHRSHAEVGQSHGGLKKGDPAERQGVLGSLFAASSNWGGVRLSNKVLPLFGK